MNLSREEMLLEMGLGPLWKLRGAGTAAGAPAADAATQRASAPADTPATESARQLSDAPRGVSPMPAAEAVRATPAHSAPAAVAPAASDPAVAGEWAALNRQIIDCRACALCAQRQQAVPGVGDQSADWLFIGEGPGAEEDARGEPFVGAAGKLLDAMLAAIDLQRGDDVYIANAVKCRPPNNRTPEAGEIAACRPYLERQVALLRPRLIVLLGRAAVQATLGLDGSLASLRGRAHAWEVGGRSIPVIVTYHPAYLLRTPLDKARAWEDLCRARALMRAAKAAALDNASTAPN
ncbi:uracil-DNA glycosylase [Rhodocyclus tenuis]|uniref:Type-4 uracil-DNA glycosylase n=1 Tax=Rhodocyclus tenuis TaxID=1066 RepID=A0A840G0C8_RHOTE|nr:uracil-DNA glycosylase [Rhodocyclus tenuis]MBB4247634.1 DNA polymerase [Rhodocyclus tenuis]